MFKKIKTGIRNFCSKVKAVFTATKAVLTSKANSVLAGTAAEAYVDTGVKILIAVVIGALLLTTLYDIFNNNIMPLTTDRIVELFNYAG